MKKLQLGTGRFKGKIPFKYFACGVRAFTKANQRIDLQIITYNFAAIPDFKYTKIIAYKG